MKEITLSKGYIALVDDEDYEWLNKFKWHACPYKRGKARAMRDKTKDFPFKYMSRMLLNVTDPNILVDHKDRNPLNNCRSNLRTCNKSQNNSNKTSRENTSSKHIGVSWDKSRNKWAAEITTNYKKLHLGRYDLEHEAALAYNIKAAELHGEFANLNQIPLI